MRHPAAPGRKASGWRAEECLTQSPQSPQSEREESGREELTRSRGGVEGLEDAFAQKDKKETKGRLECGRKANSENHENRFADMESRRDADWQSGRGRPAREDPEKRKASESANVFCNLSPAMDSTSGGAASCRAGVEGERMAGGRMSHTKAAKAAKGAGGMREERTHAEPRSAWRTLLHKRTKKKQKGGWSA